MDGRLSRGRQYVRIPAHERVLRRVRYDGDCWIFEGADNGNGYGVVGISREEGNDYAHRVVYRALVGPIPDGLQLDHVRERGCSSTRCVNPAHLEAVTPRVNVLRGERPQQMAAENRDPERRRGQRRFR